MSLQERELEHGNNVFIIHPNSNHNYKNFTVRSYQVGSGRVRVGSGIGLSSIGSFRVSGWVRLGIRSSSVGSF
jgi:hypothetical protein